MTDLPIPLQLAACFLAGLMLGGCAGVMALCTLLYGDREVGQ